MTRVRKPSQDHFEQVLAHYMQPDTIVLTDAQKASKERWEAAWGLLLNFQSREQVCKMLQTNFKISRATAYRDIASTMALFGDVHRSKKEGTRYLLLEYNQQLLQQAIEEKNMDVMGKCLDRMARLADLDKEEAGFNAQKLQLLDIEISLPRALQEAMLKMARKGVLDLNQVAAQQVDYQELNTESDG